MQSYGSTPPRLLGPDGRPIQSKAGTAIPFIYIWPPNNDNNMPAGSRSLKEIDRGPQIYALALQFMGRGGRYGITETPDGTVRMAAMLVDGQGNEDVIVEATASNDARLPRAIDQLVRDSFAKMDNPRVMQ